MISKLRECFGALDDDGSGSIGIDELEEPLIGLGFADTREDVLRMIEDVDEDGSGQIEFEEFLEIIKNSDTNEQTAKINKFFKDMSGGSKEYKSNNGKSFGIIVADKRREYMMSALLSEKGTQKEEGMKILNNVKNLVLAQK